MTLSLLLLLFFFAAPPKVSEQFDQYIKQLESKPAPQPGATVEVKGGIIHDWTESVFIPGKRPENVIAVLQAYDRYAKIYPEVLESRILSRDKDRFKVYLKLQKTKVLTVEIESEYEVEYHRQPDGSWRVSSKSTRMDEAGDTDHGFLWRLNAYWTISSERDGVTMRCRAISLTRDIPVGLGWAVRPIIKELPRESLRQTLEATRQALR